MTQTTQPVVKPLGASDSSQVSNPQKQVLAGVKVMLMGDSGMGKTYSLATLAATGLQVRVLFLENGLESLLGYWADKGQKVPENVKYMRVIQDSSSLDRLLQQAKSTSTMSQESLAKAIDTQRSSSDFYTSLLKAMKNFVDQDGVDHGSVESWGTDVVFCIDGLTGISDAVRSNVVGNKMMVALAEYPLMQQLIYGMLTNLCNKAICHVVLLSHVEKETDQINGGIRLYPATSAGKALLPKMAIHFSDVILADWNPKLNHWAWSTIPSKASCKTRNLPRGDDIKPDFKPIIDKWKARANGA